jgi:hypothetical protein
MSRAGCWCDVFHKVSGYLCIDCEEHENSKLQGPEEKRLNRSMDLLLEQKEISLREFSALFWKREACKTRGQNERAE